MNSKGTRAKMEIKLTQIFCGIKWNINKLNIGTQTSLAVVSRAHTVAPNSSMSTLKINSMSYKKLLVILVNMHIRIYE